MKVISTFAALLVAAVVTAQQPTTTTAASIPTLTPPPWSNCATGPTQMNVTSFSASPNPLCAGQPLQFTATGSLAKSIVQGASFSIVGKFLSRVFYTDNYDLCQILAAAGTPCPTAANITSLMINIRTKPNIPIGIPLVFSIQVRNGDGDITLCQSSTATASNCGNPPFTLPPTTTTTTTPHPKPTPVPGVWTTCDGPQNMTLSSFTLTPNAWCRGMQTCFNIAGTLLKNITFSAALKLYGGGSFLNFWDVDLRGQGYPYHIPAGPISFNVCGNISLYTPESPTSWKLQFMDSEQNGPTTFQWVNILCLKTTNEFQVPNCP
ncbi:hypothetical protein BG000_008755 [Podila horticola]|nr:hypothetical protein BG000_008755 [Podila horticola]